MKFELHVLPGDLLCDWTDRREYSTHPEVGRCCCLAVESPLSSGMEEENELL